MVRVAVAGVGFMGKTHLGIYGSLPNVEVTALCDEQKQRLDVNGSAVEGNIAVGGIDADLSGAARYTSFDEMIRAGGFDVVDLCLPTYLHADFSVQALRAGYHVFCEKPMALNERETGRVIDTVRETGKLFRVGQCLRFWPVYVEMRKIVASGEYGRVLAADFSRFSSTPGWSADSWILDLSRSGGAALDLHIHDTDTVLWFFGIPKSVRSQGVHAKDGGVSHITTLYQYADTVVSSTGGWICTDSFGFKMKAMLILEGATIEMDSSQAQPLLLHPAEGESRAVPMAEGDGYYHELVDFVAGIEAGALGADLTPEDAAASVHVCRSEIESLTEGREISIS